MNKIKNNLKSRLKGISVCIALGAILTNTVQAQDVRIALSGGFDRLDPSVTGNASDLNVISQIYETLLTLDYKTGELKPKLAESFEATSPTIWTFHLRDGVTFSDGTPLTAEDVKYSIERILDPNLGSTHASQLSSIKEVRAIDRLTVEVETNTPDPVLLRRMQPIGGTGRIYIVSKSHVEGRAPADIASDPMGTGPFKLASWDRGRQLKLVRNETYWGDKPSIDGAIYTTIPENSTRVNALLTGEVEVIQRLPITDVERVNASEQAHVISSPNGLVHVLQLDSRHPPFNDIEVRKAFVHAIDTKGIVEGLLGEYGRVLAVPLSPSAQQFNTELTPYSYDPELSKKLLAGKSISLETFTSDGRYVNDRDFYQIINSQLKQVGFKISSQTLEWGRFINMMSKKNGGPFYITGWDFGEGDASKMNSFLSSGAAYSITADSTYDSLVAQASQELNEARRTELWREIQKYVHDQYLVGAVWQASALYGFSKKLDWEPHFGENMNLSEFHFVSK